MPQHRRGQALLGQPQSEPEYAQPHCLLAAEASHLASAWDNLGEGTHNPGQADSPADIRGAVRIREVAHNLEGNHTLEAAADNPAGTPEQDNLVADTPVGPDSQPVGNPEADSLEAAVARRQIGEVVGYRWGVGYRSWPKDRIRPD